MEAGNMFGYARSQIKYYLRKRLRVPDINFFLDHLKNLGYLPDVIYDVGAYKGEFTLECLKRWPKANIFCFEPQSTLRKNLEALSANNPNISFRPFLLGAANHDAISLNLADTASSVLTEHHSRFETEKCHQTTIDTCGAPPPNFLKIDVQGYEGDVLKGAEHSLARCDVILVETNLIDIHKNVMLVGDLTNWLHERGFVLYDICGMHRRPIDHALWQADFAFVRADSSFRQEKRWGV
jgi:FkbM family methyltransferase